MSSSSEHGSADPSAQDERAAEDPPVTGRGPATTELWRRRAPGVPALPFAVALLGADAAELSDAASLSLADSDEAARLLDTMELRIRTLKTGVTSTPERCEFSIRGPVMWAETITARANALGNEDVFVCATAERTFDTVENRVLVGALEAIARAAKALRGPVGQRLSAVDAARIAEVSADAERWRRHPRLAGIRSGRLSGRDAARLRGGHRLARMSAVIAVRERVAEPFHAQDIWDLADDATREYHELLLAALDALELRGAQTAALPLVDGVIRVAGLSFRHPQLGSGSDAGLAYRRVSLLPPAIGSASWWDSLPTRGITVRSRADVERVLDRLAQREAARKAASPASPAAATQVSGSSS